jgi:hypothetical protein
MVNHGSFVKTPNPTPGATYGPYMVFLNFQINALVFIHIFMLFQFIILALNYRNQQLRNVRRGKYDGGNKENYVVLIRKS